MILDHPEFSRPARLAASLLSKTEEQCEQLFLEKRVLVRLEPSFTRVKEARATLLFTVNQVLRFCPNVGLIVSADGAALTERSLELATGIHGAGSRIQITSDEHVASFDAVINIGTQVVSTLPWISVNSSGWIARVATAQSGVNRLHWAPDVSNPCGALAAACFGAGAAFMTIVGRQPNLFQEISLFTHQEGAPGTLDPGPALPHDPLEIDAFIVGCGAVMNGWAYTIKKLPVVGRLQAIDRQSLRLENHGSYVLARRDLLDTPKAQILAQFLAPAITTTPRPEEWELFKIRLQHGIRTPALIVNGLDHVGTRHSVQQLWPATLIDLAAGGLTSQVIVKWADSEALCLLRAFDVPHDEVDWADRLARETGLAGKRIRNQPVTEITQTDIDAADMKYRPELEKARGKLICGRIAEQNLKMEGHDPDFTPAVPFVTAFSGVVGAAETMKQLMGKSVCLHYQCNFQSNRSRILQMLCDPECQCQEVRMFNQTALDRRNRK